MKDGKYTRSEVEFAQRQAAGGSLRARSVTPVAYFGEPAPSGRKWSGSRRLCNSL